MEENAGSRKMKTGDGAVRKRKFDSKVSEKPKQGSGGKSGSRKGLSGNVPGGAAKKKPLKAAQPLDRKARKELKEARKKRRRTHYDLEKEVVAVWEKMRGKNVKREEKRKHAAEALQKMKGKLLELALGHITCRVIQACVKYCRDEERIAVYDELRPHCLALAKNTYAYHLVIRMFDHASKEQTHRMIAQLHGEVVALLRHPSGSAVVEHAYNLGSKAEKQELLSEFYSAEFRLFKGVLLAGTGRVVDLINAEPTKKNAILQHMTLSLQPILEKGIVDHSIVHRAILEYFSIASPSLMDDVIQNLAGPLLVRMIHTKDGAKVGLTCVLRGSTKERKKIVKALKGHVCKVAREEFGHVVLLAILDVVDDTTLVAKCIIKELLKELKTQILDKYGRRVYLHLLAPGVPRYFPPDTLAALRQSQFSGTAQDTQPSFEEAKHTSAEAADDTVQGPSAGKEKADDEMQDADEDGKDKKALRGGSKKDPAIRRKELLLDSGLAKGLTETCIEHAGEFLRSPLGTDVIYEVAMGGLGGMLWTAVAPQLTTLHRAIASLATVPAVEDHLAGEDDTAGVAKDEHVLLQYFSSRTIRRLVLNARPPPEEVEAPSFSRTLWSTALKGKLEMWAKGHSSKVVSAYKDCADTSAQDAAKSEIEGLLHSGVFKVATPGVSKKGQKSHQ